MTVPKTVRQAVVVVHGMGEQRPLEALNRFIDTAIPGAASADPDEVVFYSRPEAVTGSYESRRYLAPETDRYAQTEFFEYHWAHLMEENQLSDLWATFSRMLLQWPWRVPYGLRGVWVLFWLLLAVALAYFLHHGLPTGGVSVRRSCPSKSATTATGASTSSSTG